MTESCEHEHSAIPGSRLPAVHRCFQEDRAQRPSSSVARIRDLYPTHARCELQQAPAQIPDEHGKVEGIRIDRLLRSHPLPCEATTARMPSDSLCFRDCPGRLSIDTSDFSDASPHSRIGSRVTPFALGTCASSFDPNPAPRSDQSMHIAMLSPNQVPWNRNSKPPRPIKALTGRFGMEPSELMERIAAKLVIAGGTA